jgi:hypothetical protein
MKDPLKVFLSSIGILFVVCLIFLSSCSERNRRDTKQAQQTKQATQVVNHSEENIIVETLHSGRFDDGVYKFKIDSSEYVVVVQHYNSIAIAKHK